MKITPGLLEKYHLGECSPEEQVAVENWLETGNNGDEPEYQEEAGYKVMEERIWKDISKDMPDTKKTFLWMLKYVASVAAILLVAFFAFKVFYRTHGKNIHGSTRYADSDREWHTITTGKGERKTVPLPDGTIVYMNDETSLSYDLSTITNERNILLKGEAYFLVKHDPQHPFVIRTEKTQVAVLGTHFNVKAYPEDNFTDVTVTEGRVSFAAKNKSIILTANQQGHYSDNSGELKQQNVYAEKYIRWKDNTLEFENQQMEKIVKMLERRYNIHIQINSTILKSQRFTGRFDDVSINEVLRQIGFVLKYNYTIHGQNVIIN